MQSAPGIYAVLAGSGVSSAAGVPTGWAVVQDLVRKVALAEGVDAGELGDAPEKWWAATRGEDPRYDLLLEALAPTESARQALLRNYFDPAPGSDHSVQMTAAHSALAQLCARGTVTLILTTNFDRLIERSLDQAGVSAQVIASAEAIEGMVPLTHSPMTVVKLHGDYARLGMRNTLSELREYPVELRTLLDRVFDEYGLVILGWSAEYDSALVDAISACPTRRYPTYWTTFQGRLAESARRLIADRRAWVIDTAGAEEFVPDLLERIERLDRRLARAAEPRVLRTQRFGPRGYSPPTGWTVPPLLQLRCVTAVGPALLDACGYIRPHDRAALVAALRIAPIRAWIQAIASSPSAHATLDSEEAATPEPLTDWTLTPGALQTTEHASYRLGGDASAGVSAVVNMSLPGAGSTSSIVFSLDIAMSLAGPVRLGQIAVLWRDGLVLTSTLLPEALSPVIPPEADAYLAEIHAIAWTVDQNQFHRANDLGTRVDLGALGPRTQDALPQIGLANELSGGLSEQQAAAVVAASIEIMALNAGFVEPTAELGMIRQELGVPPSEASLGGS